MKYEMDCGSDKHSKKDVDAKNKQVQNSVLEEKDGRKNEQNNDLKKVVKNLSIRINNVENNQLKFAKKLDDMEQQQMNTNICVNDPNKNQCNTGSEKEEKIHTERKETILETPVISRPVDGRLITLDEKQIDALMEICEPKVVKGGFGDVFISKSNVSKLDVLVVIKRIICTENEWIKQLSTLNEKIAARVMHFAVVPLIAYAERQLEGATRAYYFLSPYLENESLRGLIARDRMCSDINNVMMKCASRIQILFQIASALDYLHTPIPGYRGTVLHMDVTSKNIVCDKLFNARLIDFGLAREMNEGKQELSYTESMLLGTPGYFPTIRYSSLTVHEDYYNFGVVIRELLTGDLPCIDSGNVKANQLRKYGEDVIRKTQQKLIWKDENELAQGILQLSTRCLGSRVDKKLTSADIVKELKTKLKNPYQRMRQEADKCDLCMVNMADDANAPPHECNGCKMKICVSCMRNSHINPIRCPTCNEEVIPEIGHTFASLLIAGNDLTDSDCAASFRREINEIKDVIASKYPCVIGIRDENIKTITPSKPGEKEYLCPQVLSAFEVFQERKRINTLFIYFSGHHTSKTGFELGCPDDVLTKTQLQGCLMNLCKLWGNKARILVFLDCCEAPKMEIGPDLSKAGVKIIQLNVCQEEETCLQMSEDSHFQKFFVQALTRKIYNKKCYRIKENEVIEKECEYCKMSGDFISGERLLDYISDHMEKFDPHNKPVLRMSDVSRRDAYIGYNVDFAVELSFRFEVPSKEAIYVKLDQEMHSDINELKLRILQKVTCRKDVQLKLSVEFADVISLRVDPGSYNGKELTNMLQFNAAMITERDIIASCRTESYIGIGRVAMFEKPGCIYRYFDGKQMLKKMDGERIKAKLSLDDLDMVTDDIQEKPDLEAWYKILFAVYKAWKKETNKERKELTVIFPENRNDLVVLDLAEKTEETVEWFKKLAHLIMKRQYIIMSLFALLVAFIIFIFM